jgi:hypothetical protein
MVDKVRFAFTEVNPEFGTLSTFPYLPLSLTYQNRSLSTSGLLDTGSSVNVLPYELGLGLGAVWERQKFSVPLGGNLARFEARALVLMANVERFPPVELAFAWTKVRLDRALDKASAATSHELDRSAVPHHQLVLRPLHQLCGLNYLDCLCPIPPPSILLVCC